MMMPQGITVTSIQAMWTSERRNDNGYLIRQQTLPWGQRSFQ
jgi:hypothetical protein